MMGSKKEAEMKGGKNKRKMELSRQGDKSVEGRRRCVSDLCPGCAG